MTYTITGLGNPGDEYAASRHNAGRMVLELIAEQHDAEWKEDKSTRTLTARGHVGGKLALFLLPNNFMNNSGKNVAKYVKSAKAAERLVVLYDDIDLPLGAWRIAFNRGSGGHKGVESIIRSLRTKAFVRVRIGIAQTTPTGKLRKPKGEERVLKFLMGNFTPDELRVIKKEAKKIGEALELLVKEGRAAAMNRFN